MSTFVMTTDVCQISFVVHDPLTCFYSAVLMSFRRIILKYT